MKKTLHLFNLILVMAVLSVGIIPASIAAAAPPKASSTPIGYDISWPQCGKTLPTGQAFGIVGVNGGLANNSNPCFADQLAWAEKSVGNTGQDKVALYVNTANPEYEGSWWPESNTYKDHVVDNPYGTCDYSLKPACAYMYGYAKAYDNATIRGVANPGSYMWWLDVETMNSWSSNKEANRADLEGMVAYYKTINARVGLYSTGYQWGQIVGSVPAGSSLYNLPSWLAGSSQRSAKADCGKPPLTGGGLVHLTQYVSKNLDHNYSCI